MDPKVGDVAASYNSYHLMFFRLGHLATKHIYKHVLRYHRFPIACHYIQL